MSDTETPKPTQGGHSVLSRIEALRSKGPLFDHIATHPQSGIYNRFETLWPKLAAAIEGEVYERNALFDAFVFRDSYTMDLDLAEDEFWKFTTSLADAVTLHSKVVKAWRASSLAPLVSERTMDIYRIHSSFKCGNDLAANGQPSVLYSTQNTNAHAAICDEDFDRLDSFVAKWILQPCLNCLELVSKPFRCSQSQHAEAQDVSPKSRTVFHAVSVDAISAWARSFMLMVAVSSAAAAIFTLNRVKEREMRIVVMGLFALVYALLIQFLSPRSLPMYTLILSFFQSMVMFVGTADDDVE